MWHLLTERARHNALGATAAAWLEAFREAPHKMKKPEKELTNRVLSDYKGNLLNPSLKNWEAVGVRSFELFGFSESDCIRWINLSCSRGGVAVTRGATLGKLVKTRKWREAAEVIFGVARANYTGYKSALEYCYKLLGNIKQLKSRKILGRAVSVNDKRHALFEAACQLYGEGIKQNSIWERAGGNLSAAHLQSNAKTQWGESLKTMHEGGGGENLNAQSLIKTMLDDFQNNDDLKTLLEMFS